MRFLQWVLGGITIIGLLYLISMNADHINFFWSPAAQPIDLPVYMIIMAAFGGGYFVGLFYYWLGNFPHYLKRQKDIHTLERRIRDLETELENTQA